MYSEVKGEVITAREALDRVGLDISLGGEGDHWADDNNLVEWVGYPKPFACGHTAQYGYGPKKEGVEDAGRRGEGRIYQQVVRVNQYYCSGPVLFSWRRVARSQSGTYYIASQLVVSIDELPDSKSTCLRAGVTA